MAEDTVAVLGLGAMGLPMATRLTQDFAVRGFDPDAARRDALQREGGQVTVAPEQAVQSAAVVVIAVRTLAQAKGCLFGEAGEAGAVAGLAEGTAVVLTSTVGAQGARELETELAGHGVHLVDAPVSGGSSRAGTGELLVLVGGSAVAVAAARPVLDALAATVVVVGPRVGDGQSMKIVNQLLCGVHIAAAAEALVLARSLGIEPSAALEAIGSGAAASFMLGDRGPRIARQLAGEAPEVRSRLDIFVKDMGLVAEAAAEGGVTLPVAAASESLFQLGQERGLAACDDSGVALAIAAQAE